MGQSEVIIPEKIFFKIGEVCDLVEVQAHVLRYWETEFPMLSPKKNRSGQRTYRRRDVEIALNIKDLLYEDLYTIAGAKKRLQTNARSSNAVKKTEPQKANLDVKPGDQPSLIDMGEMPVTEANVVQHTSVELDGERRDALKSLASQLLELREILKTDQSTNTDTLLSDLKRV